MTRKEAQDTLYAIVGEEDRETEQQDPREEQKPEVLGVLACGTAPARPYGVTQRGALD